MMTLEGPDASEVIYALELQRLTEGALEGLTIWGF